MTGWTVPRLWAGETAFVLGGGPSLAAADITALRGRGRTVAINNAFALAPWADVLYWTDRAWFEWHHREIGDFAGLRVTRSAPHIRHDVADVKVLGREKKQPLSRNPAFVAGRGGGANAINLAFLFGAARIVLLGFDMRDNGHWHPPHPRPSREGIYADVFIPEIEAMAPQLALDGVKVVNCSPGSALTCFPFAPFKDVLNESAV